MYPALQKQCIHKHSPFRPPRDRSARVGDLVGTSAASRASVGSACRPGGGRAARRRRRRRRRAGPAAVAPVPGSRRPCLARQCPAERSKLADLHFNNNSGGISKNSLHDALGFICEEKRRSAAWFIERQTKKGSAIFSADSKCRRVGKT